MTERSAALKKVKASAEALARRFATLPSPDPQARDKCRRRTLALVKDGRLVREPCELCRAEKVQAHHENYVRPDYVRWLCHRCHHAVHHWGWLLELRLPANPTDDEGARYLAGGLMRVIALVADEVDKQTEAAEKRGAARPVLTLSEAAAVSGLSQAYLKRAIKDGSLKAIQDRGWKIRRKDLEAL